MKRWFARLAPDPESVPLWLFGILYLVGIAYCAKVGWWWTMAIGGLMFPIMIGIGFGAMIGWLP